MESLLKFLSLDEPCKLKTYGGLTVVAFLIWKIATSTHENNLESFEIDKQRGQIEVDVDRFNTTYQEWKWFMQEKAKLEADIEMKKSAGDVEPFTEEQKNEIRNQLKKLKESSDTIQVADPEKVIQAQEHIREVYRLMPPVEKMQKRLDMVDATIAEFTKNQKSFDDLRYKIDASKKTIAANTARLEYLRGNTWKMYLIGIPIAIVALLVFWSGYKQWTAKMKPKDPVGKKIYLPDDHS